MGHSTSSGRTTEFRTILSKTDYRYHGTTEAALRGITRNGLQPSSRGRAGAGIYFAYTTDDAEYWAEEQHRGPHVVLRVRGDHLNKAGYYDDNDEEGIAPRAIPPENIEVLRRRNGRQEWVPLKRR